VSRNSTLAANGLGLVNLVNSWAGVAHREEKLWVFGEASSFVQPMHIHSCSYSFVLKTGERLRPCQTARRNTSENISSDGRLTLKSDLSRTFLRKSFHSMTGLARPKIGANNNGCVNSMADKATKPLGLKVILVIFALELALLLGLDITYVVATLAGEVKSLATMLALAALGLILLAWLGVTFRALSQGRRWSRNATLFWQLVQLAVAWGSFTGQFANAAIGIGLIVPSVLVIGLLFSRPVFAATQGEIPEED
jgi:hypothetical protein